MKFTRGHAPLFLSSVCSLAIACGSPTGSGLFSERGGASNQGVAGVERARAGSTSDEGGAGGTASAVAGQASNDSAGKDSGGTPGSSGAPTSSDGGTTSGGGAGISASAGKTSSIGGAAGASAGTGGTGGVSAGAGGSATGGVSGWSGGSGWNGWSGANGASGSGGAGACPASPPQKGETCDVTTPNSCFYAGARLQLFGQRRRRHQSAEALGLLRRWCSLSRHEADRGRVVQDERGRRVPVSRQRFLRLFHERLRDALGMPNQPADVQLQQAAGAEL